MRTIDRLIDLRDFGFDLLTGEACQLSYRLLLDVTEEGARIFRLAYGLPSNCRLADAWNRGTDEEPSVGSVMLPRDAWKMLGLFCLQYGRESPQGAIWLNSTVGGTDPFWYGFRNDKELKQITSCKTFKIHRVWNCPQGESDRNEHMISGRSI